MRITRRQFEKRIGQALLSSGLFTWSGCKPRPSEKSAPSGAQETSVLRMTRGGVDLAVPADQPAGETWRYGLAFPFQIAAKRAAIFANIRGKRGQYEYSRRENAQEQSLAFHRIPPRIRCRRWHPYSRIRLAFRAPGHALSRCDPAKIPDW